jgi:mRNA (guanine-N7-)-methyltransferase
MFVMILLRFGLMMIGKQRFQNYFQQRKDQPEGSKLLNRMNALETFPCQRLSGDEDQYEHVAEYKGGEQVGTLSRDEWEALTIYTVFAFKKMR